LISFKTTLRRQPKGFCRGTRASDGKSQQSEKLSIFLQQLRSNFVLRRVEQRRKFRSQIISARPLRAHMPVNFPMFTQTTAGSGRSLSSFLLMIYETLGLVSASTPIELDYTLKRSDGRGVGEVGIKSLTIKCYPSGCSMRGIPLKNE
jgi:hypothetical protein